MRAAAAARARFAVAVFSVVSCCACSCLASQGGSGASLASAEFGSDTSDSISADLTLTNSSLSSALGDDELAASHVQLDARVLALAARLGQWLECKRRTELLPVQADQCPANFDGHLCWPATLAGGQAAHVSCPTLLGGNALGVDQTQNASNSPTLEPRQGKL